MSVSSTAALHSQVNTFHYDPNLCPICPPLTSAPAEIYRSRDPQGSCEPSRPDPATSEPLVSAAMKLQTDDEQLIHGTYNQHLVTSQLSLKVHSRAHVLSFLCIKSLVITRSCSHSLTLGLNLRRENI